MIIYADTKYRPKRKSKKRVNDVFEKAAARPFQEMKRPLGHRPLRQSDLIPSRNIVDAVAPKAPIKYEGELAEREAAAQREIERKKKMVAPLYNKGGYQYVGDASEEIIKNLGKKV